MRIFVTGASSGLGEAIARECHRRWGAEGDLVLGLVARREPLLRALSDALPQATVACYALDVTQAQALASAGQDFLARFGAPDFVIANAGISAGTVTGENNDSQVFASIFQTNVVAMFETFAPFVSAMRAAGKGALVGIASVAGIRGLPGAGAYSASKSAAITYLESLRLEMRGSGVAVVTIAPGFVRTPLTRRNPYPMPFLMDADVFARRAVDAMLARRSFVVIPWPMRFVALLLRVLPNWLYDRLFARAPRKPRLPS